MVATSRSISKAGYTPSAKLALVEGDISQAETAEKVAKMAMEKFGSIDHVVNNAGIYSSKPFTEYSAEELRAFVSTNLDGFVFITQVGGAADAGSRQGRERNEHQRIAGR